MPAIDLTTTARVKDLLKIPTTITTQDTLIARLISQYSNAIERYLQRHVESKARTEQYDAKYGDRRIWLKGFPVASITDLRNDYELVFAAGTIVAATDYVLYPNTGEVYFKLWVPIVGPRAIQVNYVGGLSAAGSIPTDYPDLALACEKQVAFYTSRKGLAGTTGSTAQGGSVSLDKRGKEGSMGSDFIPEVQSLLEPFVRMAYGGWEP